MVSLADSSTKYFVVKLAGKGVWTGGHRLTPEDNSWGWSDGSAWHYTNWQEDQPNSRGQDYCVVMYEVGWNDIKCSKNRSFVCQQSPPLPGVKVHKEIRQDYYYLIWVHNSA